MGEPEREDHVVACFPDQGFALARLRGDIYGDDIVDVGRTIATHPEWRPGFTEVWDMNQTAAVDLTPADLPKLQSIETELKDLLAGTRTIVIVDRPMLRYSLQFYSHMVRPFGREIVVVRTNKEAADLLGIPALPELRKNGR